MASKLPFSLSVIYINEQAKACLFVPLPRFGNISTTARFAYRFVFIFVSNTSTLGGLVEYSNRTYSWLIIDARSLVLDDPLLDGELTVKDSMGQGFMLGLGPWVSAVRPRQKSSDVIVTPLWHCVLHLHLDNAFQNASSHPLSRSRGIHSVPFRGPFVPQCVSGSSLFGCSLFWEIPKKGGCHRHANFNVLAPRFGYVLSPLVASWILPGTIPPPLQTLAFHLQYVYRPQNVSIRA